VAVASAAFQANIIVVIAVVASIDNYAVAVNGVFDATSAAALF
jgi:hypothetical protein